VLISILTKNETGEQGPMRPTSCTPPKNYNYVTHSITFL